MAITVVKIATFDKKESKKVSVWGLHLSEEQRLRLFLKKKPVASSTSAGNARLRGVGKEGGIAGRRPGYPERPESDRERGRRSASMSLCLKRSHVANTPPRPQ